MTEKRLPMDPQEVSKLMRINVDMLKKELTDHIDSEIERYKYKLSMINSPGYFE